MCENTEISAWSMSSVEHRQYDWACFVCPWVFYDLTVLWSIGLYAATHHGVTVCSVVTLLYFVLYSSLYQSMTVESTDGTIRCKMWKAFDAEFVFWARRKKQNCA